MGTPISATNTSTDALGIDTLTIDTQRNAWVALKKIDAAIDQVNSARANLGALQSRFESAVSNISIQVENLAAAKGRIVDADFAQETANLSRTQILQQAGTAMVAQANKLPQGVLSLLQS
jgi:flagellin